MFTILIYFYIDNEIWEFKNVKAKNPKWKQNFVFLFFEVVHQYEILENINVFIIFYINIQLQSKNYSEW